MFISCVLNILSDHWNCRAIRNFNGIYWKDERNLRLVRCDEEWDAYILVKTVDYGRRCSGGCWVEL